MYIRDSFVQISLVYMVCIQAMGPESVLSFGRRNIFTFWRGIEREALNGVFYNSSGNVLEVR